MCKSKLCAQCATINISSSGQEDIISRLSVFVNAYVCVCARSHYASCWGARWKLQGWIQCRREKENQWHLFRCGDQLHRSLLAADTEWWDGGGQQTETQTGSIHMGKTVVACMFVMCHGRDIVNCIYIFVVLVVYTYTLEAALSVYFLFE